MVALTLRSGGSPLTNDQVDTNFRSLNMGANCFTVLDKDLSTPPGSPSAGDSYIVGASPTGAWAGQAGKYAEYYNAAWEFIAIGNGIVYVNDENAVYVVENNEMVPYPSGSAAIVTFENLNANGDIGSGAAQVAAGNHTHSGIYEPADATIVKDADFASNGILKRTSEGVYSIVTDNSDNWNTAYSWGNHSGLYLRLAGAGNKSVAGAPYIPETTLTDGSTITWDFNTHNTEAKVTIAGNRTLAGSNIPPAGTWAHLRVIQSGTGRTLAFTSFYDMGDLGIPDLTSGNGKEDVLAFRSNGTVMQFMGIAKGFA